VSPTEPAPLDIPRLLDTLDQYRVEFLLVGGIAAIAHGARCPTNDLDCVTRRTPRNLDRLAAAMRELHARLHVEGLSDDEASTLPVQVVGATLARMEISTWRTDAGDLDILADLPDRAGRRRSFDELITRAERLDLSGLVVQVAALDDVIQSKQWADRPKDRDALPELLRLQEQQARG
jgi:hypothetical protein